MLSPGTLTLCVRNVVLGGSGGASVDAYVQAVVLEGTTAFASKKTRTQRNARDAATFGETLALHARETQSLCLRVFDAHSFRKDTLLGELDLGPVAELALGSDCRGSAGNCEVAYDVEFLPRLSMGNMTHMMHARGCDVVEIARGGHDYVRRFGASLGPLQEPFAAAFLALGQGLAGDDFKGILEEQFGDLDRNDSGALEFAEIFPRHAHVWFEDLMRRAGFSLFEELPAAPRRACADPALLRKQWRVFDTDETDSLSKDQFVAFTSSIALWQLTVMFLASRARAECGVGEAELKAIWKRFEKFDRDVSCTMDAGEMALLLQDMGETYSGDEMRIIFEDMDADHDGVLDLLEFVHWWCSIPV